jgi:hypothetical protein
MGLTRGIGPIPGDAIGKGERLLWDEALPGCSVAGGLPGSNGRRACQGAWIRSVGACQEGRAKGLGRNHAAQGKAPWHRARGLAA